jgi:Transposase
MEVAVDKVWVGIDAGKEFHWVHVLDASGRELFSRKLENDETEISELVGKVVPLAKEVVWAVDQPGGSVVLLLALLWERSQEVLYVPGLSVNRASDAYRGESKTDARDARVIVDQARMRSDLDELEPGEEEVAQLRILLGRRDLLVDQNRTIARLGEALLSLSPALERMLDLNRRGPLTLLTRYQSPAQLRRAGHKRIAAYLRKHGVKRFDGVAARALGAAKSQSITLPAEPFAARIVAELAAEILALKDRLEDIDEQIERRFLDRPEAEIHARLPGIGPLLGGRVPRRRRGPLGLRWRRPSGRLCGPGARRQRLRKKGRQQPQDARRKQEPQKGFLPVGLRQPTQSAGVQGLLRPKEGRGQEARPGTQSR